MDGQWKVRKVTTEQVRGNPVVSIDGIASFEARFDVRLPTEYRDLLLSEANGGSFGPRYGTAAEFVVVPADQAVSLTDFPPTSQWPGFEIGAAIVELESDESA